MNISDSFLFRTPATLVVATILGGIAGLFSVSSNPNTVAMSWIVFLLIAAFLIYGQTRTPLAAILSFISAYFVFMGARVVVSMTEIAISEESFVYKFLAGIMSILGVAVVGLGLNGHFRKMWAIRTMFWVSIIFAIGTVSQIFRFASGEASYLDVGREASRLLLWIGVAWFSHYLGEHPEKLTESAKNVSTPRWLW